MTEPKITLHRGPVPAILLTGFLGAGKTTLLNRFLEHFEGRPQKTAVLVNEFGAAGVDAHLLSPGSRRVYEVNRGSIFCVCVKEDFIGALDSIASADPPFDLVLIEATGVAQTRNLGLYLEEPPLSGKIRIRRNICLVDALSFHKVHATLPAAREQVEEADVIVLNKVNLTDEPSIRKQETLVSGRNPHAPLVRWDGGPIDVDMLLADDGTASRTTRDDICSVPPPNLRSLTVAHSGTLDPDRLREFLSSITDSFYRIKGIVRFPSGPFLCEQLHDGWSIRPLREYAEEESILVFIARAMNEEALRKGFESCGTAG